MEMLRLELHLAESSLLLFGPVRLRKFLPTGTRINSGQKRKVLRLDGPEDDREIRRNFQRKPSLGTWRENALQGDAEIHRQIRHHIVMRQTASRRREGSSSKLNNI